MCTENYFFKLMFDYLPYKYYFSTSLFILSSFIFILMKKNLWRFALVIPLQDYETVRR